MCYNVDLCYNVVYNVYTIGVILKGKSGNTLEERLRNDMDLLFGLDRDWAQDHEVERLKNTTTVVYYVIMCVLMLTCVIMLLVSVKFPSNKMLQEHEAAQAQLEVERRIAESRAHEEESRRLQLELDRARLEMEENQRALQEALASPKVLYVREHDDDNKASGKINLTCSIRSVHRH